MKKLFLIVCTLCFSLALAFGFTACGGNDGVDTSVVPVVSVGINKNTLELETGDTYVLIATVMPSNATDKTLTWSSSNESVATVTNGKITAVAAGTAQISVTAGDRTAVCSLTVTEKSVEIIPVVSITLNKETLKINVGDTFDFIPTVLPANATDRTVKWATDSDCVTISDKGKLSAVSGGTANITATAGEKKAVCEVTVVEKISVTEVTLDKEEVELAVGDTDELTAQILPSDATETELKWHSSNESAVTVEDGVITAKAVGSATITVTVDGKSAYCEVTVKAKVVPVTGVDLDKKDISLEIGSSAVIRAIVTPEDATNVKVDWKSSDTDVATVVNGAVLAKAVGETTITATVNGIEAECKVTVKEKTVVPVTGVTLNKTELELKIGATFTLTATVVPENATDKEIEWTSSNKAAATVENGVVTAKAVGSTTITAKAGEIEATCAVTVSEATVEATSITLNKTDLELKEGETFTLTATIAPSNSTENDVIWTSSDSGVATVENGVVTAKKAGTAIIKAKVGKVEAECELAVIEDSGNVNPTPDDPVIDEDSVITYAHAGEECAAFEWTDSKASGAKVEYKLSTETKYTAVDSQLIRQKDSKTVRADILGLKGGAKYDFKITSSDKKVSNVNGVSISSIDRSGYAHHNYTSGVGAYNDDGTLKSNAVVFYVTEENKNDIDGKGNSIAEYLSNMKNVKTPVVIRIVGTVGSATWNEITYDMGDAQELSADKVIGANGQKLPTSSSSLTQEYLSKNGYNTLNEYPEAYGGKRCVAINGLNSKASYSSGEYDSCWNDCQVQNANNLTIEGVGEDAEIFQWGFTFKNCNSIEVRNLRFYDYTEDACSVEASSNTASETDPDSFTYKHFWIHHNIFDIGKNYWDVCAEQDKHDGDGATDFKYISYVTVSYNRYNETHKTGLVGGGDTVYTASLTFHHNYYNHCDQRMPLGRQANMHIYNNYFCNSGLYSISLRARAYAFVENCVFTSSSKDTKPIEFRDDKSTGTPSAKVIDCQIEGTITNQFGEQYLYVGNDRTATVEGANKYGLNFEQADGFYTVTNKLATSEVADKIPDLAGTMKRVSNITIEGGSEEPPVVNPDPVDPDPTGGQSLTYTSAGATVSTNDEISDGDLFTATWTSKGTVTQDFSTAVADDNSNKSFDYALVNNGTGGGFTVTAKKAITLTVYYGATNSDFAIKDQTKNGVLSWTINGGTATESKKSVSKSNTVAYSEVITLAAGDEAVFSFTTSRLVLFGLFAE